MSMLAINGITIKLWVPDLEEVEPDGFNFVDNKAVHGEWKDVDDVLVTPMSDTEILETVNLYGRKAVYQLGIPKGDTHEWVDGGFVYFFDELWRIVGHPTQGIEAMIPLRWNKKVRVESVNGAEIHF